MIARDRDLLARLMMVNTQLGKFTVGMLDRCDGGELPADGCRDLGEHLLALGRDLIDRADELDAVDGAVVEAIEQ